MNRLFLDTSNKYLYVSVYSDSNKIFEYNQIGNNNHSETLIKVLEEKFKEYNLLIDDIDEIYVGRGPGSYTGTRVSCTVAKVLSYIKKIPLFSFSTFDLLLTSTNNKGNILVLIDARRGYSYAKSYVLDDKVEIILDECYIENNEVLKKHEDFYVINQDNNNYDVLKLLKLNLYRKEESVHNFVPTYLRSGV